MWRNESEARGVNCTVVMSSSRRVFCSNKKILHENRKKKSSLCLHRRPRRRFRRGRGPPNGRNGRPFLDRLCAKMRVFGRLFAVEHDPIAGAAQPRHQATHTSWCLLSHTDRGTVRPPGPRTMDRPLDISEVLPAAGARHGEADGHDVPPDVASSRWAVAAVAAAARSRSVQRSRRAARR